MARCQPRKGRPGPVLTVVRDTTSGKIYVGLNTGVPKNVSDVLYKSILAQKARIWQGEVVLVRTDPEAVGGHSEVNALNPAILDRERVLGRKLTEKDLGVFELHNLWLSGNRAMTTAPRCEHCARISRGVSVTQSLFVAEGGVVGEVNVLQRGSVIWAGGGASRSVTTAAGEIDVPERGSVTPAGSRTSRSVTTTSGTIEASEGGGLIGPALGGCYRLRGSSRSRLSSSGLPRTTCRKKKWSAEARAMVIKAIEGSVYQYNILIMSRRTEIEKEKAARRQVKVARRC